MYKCIVIRLDFLVLSVVLFVCFCVYPQSSECPSSFFRLFDELLSYLADSSLL